jgi:membrane-bound inhibitor of C-type lysozyme
MFPYIHRNPATTILGVALALGVSQALADKIAPTLHAAGGNAITYHCDKAKTVIARYYNLSDGSLSFVKLSLNGKVYTLPQVVSGSGARYTSEHDVEWWTKGDGALLNENITDAKAKVASCQQQPKGKTAVKAKTTTQAKTKAAGKVKAAVSKAEAINKPTVVVKTKSEEPTKTKTVTTEKKPTDAAIKVKVETKLKLQATEKAKVEATVTNAKAKVEAAEKAKIESAIKAKP